MDDSSQRASSCLFLIHFPSFNNNDPLGATKQIIPSDWLQQSMVLDGFGIKPLDSREHHLSGHGFLIFVKRFHHQLTKEIHVLSFWLILS